MSGREWGEHFNLVREIKRGLPIYALTLSVNTDRYGFEEVFHGLSGSVERLLRRARQKLDTLGAYEKAIARVRIKVYNV